MSNIQNMSLEDIMGERFGRYSKYIIQERALPDIRDGLKPVQRRILYSMNKDGNTHDKGYRKSAKSVGNIMGNFHPHGDSSIYDAMVRMSQDWKNREILVEMHGNNGSMDGDPPAAMRYTEARLSEIAGYLLQDIDKNTVPWAWNFDDTEKEPTVLPAAFPNLLVNGATGISAGYATDIPPHNLSEVIDAVVYMIDHPSAKLDKLNSCLVQISQQGLSFRARMRFVRPTKLVRAASLCAHVLKLNNSKVARNKSSLLKFLTMSIRQFLLKKSMMFESITRFQVLRKFVMSLTVQGCVLLLNLRRMLTAKLFLTTF